MRTDTTNGQVELHARELDEVAGGIELLVMPKRGYSTGWDHLPAVQKVRVARRSLRYLPAIQAARLRRATVRFS